MREDFVLAAELSLKSIVEAQLPNGAISASVRRVDNVYSHVYPRDCSRISLALDRFGQHHASRKLLNFLLAHQLPSGEWAQGYTVGGNLPAGMFLGLTEVDNQGLVLCALGEHFAVTDDRAWLTDVFPKIERGISFALKQFHREQNLIWSMASIHEFPPWEAGFDIWTNMAVAAGMRAAAGLARELGKKREAEGWEILAQKIINAVIAKHWDAELGFFLKRPHRRHIDWGALFRIVRATRRTPRFPLYLLSYLQYYSFAQFYLSYKYRKLPLCERFIDISAFAPALFGILDDHKAEQTVAAIEEFLWDKKVGGIDRYREGVAPDPGATSPLRQDGHGPWSTYTCWLAGYFARKGEASRAERYLEWVIEEAFKGGLMAEHISRITGRRFAEDFMWGKAELLLALWEYQKKFG